jgi:putative lumazine-binding protein
MDFRIISSGQNGLDAGDFDQLEMPIDGDQQAVVDRETLHTSSNTGCDKTVRMRKVTLVTLLLFVATSAMAEQKSSEEAGVRVALEHYLMGHITGDGANFRLAFRPEANLFWIREGQLATRTSEEFAAGAKGTPAPDEAQRKRRIDLIDISGNAAIAKLTLDYPDVTFTDYMSLLKIGDEWKIVNKIFYADRKKK